MPQFPAACPWVTSVGATTGQPEEAAFFSAGGFSNLWNAPDYQTSAVAKYLTNLGDKWNGLFNPFGRGFPDVSAQGVHFPVIDKGTLLTLYGTSCSTPVFAGVIALLNDARLRAGKPLMGFLNPWLYGAGCTGLNDITAGNSVGCDGDNMLNQTIVGSGIVPNASWEAVSGWDPVTGLGTPAFDRMLNLALS